MTQVLLSISSKQFSNAITAVDHLTLDIPDGKLTALLGPSGVR
jgi:ABC-type Fe3+/spermidine/putrescine transport system ATPase subunit